MDACAPLKLALGICVPENRTKVFPRGPHVFLRDTPSPASPGLNRALTRSLVAGWASPPLQTSNDPWDSFTRVGLVRRVGGPKPSEVVHLLCSCFRSFQFLGQDKNTQAIYHSTHSINHRTGSQDFCFPPSCTSALDRFHHTSLPALPAARPPVAARAVWSRAFRNQPLSFWQPL